MDKYNEQEVSRIYEIAGTAMCKLIAGEEITEEENNCIEEYRRIHNEFIELIN